MSKVRVKKSARRSKRRKTDAKTSPASLPPQGAGLTQPTSVAPPVSSQADSVAPTQALDVVPAPAAKKAFWDIGKESKGYERCMQILAMRAAGIDDKEIAANLGLSMQTVWNYCYIAGKNEWGAEFANAKDNIEFRIMPKVMRELEAGLDDRHRNEKTGVQVATAVALKIAEGTVFKKFGDVGTQQQPNNIIAIRIENAGGTPMTIREENIQGTPAYVEGEVADEPVAE